MSVQCETVRVMVTSEGENVAELVVPAYTRQEDDFRLAVNEHLEAYVWMSERSGNSMSVGDFVLYLLRQASGEPRTQ